MASSRTDQQIADELWREATGDFAELMKGPRGFDVNKLTFHLAVSRILAEVRAAEREECAKIAETTASPAWKRISPDAEQLGMAIALGIRSRQEANHG